MSNIKYYNNADYYHFNRANSCVTAFYSLLKKNDIFDKLIH